MKISLIMLTLCLMLNGCGVAFFSVAGIPATEYCVYAIKNDHEASVAVPVTTGLVAAHGGATYLLWVACWPGAVAYLGISGLYTIIRITIEEQ